MSGARAVILACFKDVPKEIEAEWNRWYETTHIPLRLALPGLIAARRFRACAGECQYVTLCELENADAVLSASYFALEERESALPATSLEARMRELPRFVRGVHQQVYPDAP